METTDTSTIIEYNDGTVKIIGNKPATVEELEAYLEVLSKHIDSWREDSL